MVFSDVDMVLSFLASVLLSLCSFYRFYFQLHLKLYKSFLSLGYSPAHNHNKRPLNVQHRAISEVISTSYSPQDYQEAFHPKRPHYTPAKPRPMKHSHHELYHQDIAMEEVEDRVFASVTQVHTGSGDNIGGDCGGD